MRRTSAWTTIGLIVLAVVALVLAFAAMRSTRGTATPEPLASALTDPTDEPRKNEGEQTAELEDALPEAIEPALVMVSDTVAYRARIGSCLGGATVERSTDGGVRWRQMNSPAPAVLSLSSTGGDAVDAVGADDRCKVRVWSSTDRGESWSDAARASDLFTWVPGDPSRLATPSGEVKNPCPQRSEAPLSVETITATEAAVLCVTGDVFTTDDGGAKWTAQVPVIGGQAMAFDSADYGWVLQRDSGNCPAYLLKNTQDGGQSWQTGGCLGVEVIADERQLPSLAFADTALGMADLDGDVYITSDSGLTWQKAS